MEPPRNKWNRPRNKWNRPEINGTAHEIKGTGARPAHVWQVFFLSWKNDCGSDKRVKGCSHRCNLKYRLCRTGIRATNRSKSKQMSKTTVLVPNFKFDPKT